MNRLYHPIKPKNPRSSLIFVEARDRPTDFRASATCCITSFPMAIAKREEAQAEAELEREMDLALVSNRELLSLIDDFGMGSPGPGMIRDKRCMCI